MQSLLKNDEPQLQEKNEYNLIELSTWGGCSSRAIFNSQLSPGYKKIFHINFSVEGGSLISLMSEPTPIDKTLLTNPKPFSNLCIEHDFSKTFLDFLKEDSIDYLLMDTSFDLTGLILLSNGNFITDTGRLHQTKLYDTLEIERRITYNRNFKEFFKLWKKSCRLFFKYINQNCDDLKIILNGSRWVYKYFENEKLHVHYEFKKKSENRNKYRDLLDKFILENYDVEFLPFGEHNLIDKNHIFGLGPAHYNSNYYSEKMEQLTEIIRRDRLLTGSLKDINYNFRKLKRENAIFRLKNNESLKLDKVCSTNSVNNILNNELKKYATARLDIKNKGEKTNSIKVLSITDATYVRYPKWFNNEEGKGLIIQSHESELDFEIECINDGILNIYLRGVDIKDKNRKRFPVYVDFKKFMINGKDYLKNNQLVCHDTPHLIKKDVKSAEVIKIHTEWSPFTKNSNYENK